MHAFLEASRKRLLSLIRGSGLASVFSCLSSFVCDQRKHGVVEAIERLELLNLKENYAFY